MMSPSFTAFQERARADKALVGVTFLDNGA
jgi:hypothetical protein